MVKQGAGAITTGCMRPFVPRTNKNELTTMVKQGAAKPLYATHERSYVLVRTSAWSKLQRQLALEGVDMLALDWR